MTHIERVAPVATAGLILLSSSVLFAAFSAAAHSHWDTLSYFLLILSMVFGFLALLKIANLVSSQFSIGRTIHWVHAMCFECVVFAILILLRFLPKKIFFKLGASSGRPILLVHGYCNNSTVWTYIQWMLAKEGIGPIYTIDLGHPFCSMTEYVKAIKLLMAKIQKETGHPHLVLIGHSMGGIVSSLVALQEPEAIHSVITIGSPLNGTCLANIGVGLTAREMRRKSECLTTLNEQLKAKIKPQFYHIGTKTDQIVIPGCSALRGDCPENEFLFEDLGHASLLFSTRVADLLVHWLKNMEKSPILLATDSEGLQCKEDNKSL